MTLQRIYPVSDHMQIAEHEPIPSVIEASEHAVIVAWHVEPGQVIAPHTHPAGQVHGVVALGSQALRFVSVVSPGDAGYEPLLGGA